MATLHDLGRPIGLALLFATLACGESRSSSSNRDPDATPSGEARDECPDGYPYCPALDACLLPGRSCPESGAGGASSEPPPEPPLESTPGAIRCGARLCDSFTEYCCSGAGGNGSGGAFGANGTGGLASNGEVGTTSSFATCSSSFCPYRRECDETADCVGTEICCYSVVSSPPPILAGSCQQPDDCAYDGYWIACATQAECQAVGAPPCVDQPCGGDTLQTCGPITRSACK